MDKLKRAFGRSTQVMGRGQAASALAPLSSEQRFILGVMSSLGGRERLAKRRRSANEALQAHRVFGERIGPNPD